MPDKTIVTARSRPVCEDKQLLRCFISRVSAGFPKPSGDYEEARLDLHRHYVTNEPATYIVKVSGDSMKDAGILDGDHLTVDQSRVPVDQDVVVADLNGELTIKRLRILNGRPFLTAENARYPPIEVQPGDEFMVRGVVVSRHGWVGRRR